MKRETVLNVAETALDVVSIGGLSMGGIATILGIILLNPVVIIGSAIGVVAMGKAYSSVKDDFGLLNKSK
jgi:uncharacterized membrane protein